ncbi:MAG: hypothetical protein ACYS0I_16900 [Planctomycetota bacterium]
MAKNGVLRVAFIALTLKFALLLFSCAPVSYDFIGTWHRQADKLTYINPDQHMKVTFPNDNWQVYTKPNEIPNASLRQGWKKATKEDTTYHVLLAIESRFPLIMQVLVELVENEDITLDEYLIAYASKARMAGTIKGVSLEDFSCKAIQQRGRRIGECFLTDQNIKFLFIIFKEKGRFTTLAFNCFEGHFETRNDQFWAIFDSYEYLE